VNWSKYLQQYAKCLNNEKREALGWRSPFEVYYGRKSNELVNCGKTIGKNDESVVQQCVHPSKETIKDSEQKN